MFTKKFWKKAFERAVKTVAQTAVAMIPVGVSVTAVDWTDVAGVSVLAGGISVLTSLASSFTGDKEDPSLVS